MEEFVKKHNFRWGIYSQNFQKRDNKKSFGAVHKRPPQSWGVVQCGHFADKGEGSLQMQTSAHFGAKP